MFIRNTLKSVVGILSAALLIASAPNATGQDEFSGRKLYFDVKPLQGGDMATIQKQSDQAQGLRIWSYSVVSTRKGSSGKTYSGAMVGNTPLLPNGTSTTTVFVQPVILKIGGVTFDPTTPDNNCLSGKVPLTVLKNSPMVQATHDFKINGVDVGPTQYSDAFQRANFWEFVSVFGGIYHNKLRYKFLPAQVIAPDPASSHLYSTGSLCSPHYGGIEVSYFDFLAKFFLIPITQVQGVRPTNLPVFLLYNTTMYRDTPDHCCIGGYHGAYGSPVQTYSATGFDTAGFFADAPDVAIMSHEINEWQDDPFGNNPTPKWGHIGQVDACQGNLEVGDPLSGTNLPVVKMSKFNYHLQELAFFSWFYGKPSTGAGGKFSDNGTLTSPQGACR